MALSKNKLKYIRALQQKKYRQKYNKFLAEGDKIVREILAAGHPVEWLLATPGWLSRTPQNWPTDQLIEVSERELEQASGLSTPQGVLAVVEQLSPPPTPLWRPGQWGLFLSDIQDPGNAGTMLRIADWFGWHPVIFSQQTADLYHPKVIQASMGAFLRVPVFRQDLPGFMADYPDCPRYAADAGGESVFAQRHLNPGLLVIGNEGRGLSPDLTDLIQHKLSIPPGRQGGAESLNAAVACGILVAALTHR